MDAVCGEWGNLRNEKVVVVFAAGAPPRSINRRTMQERWLMIRDKVGHFDFPMTRTAIENEFLEEMDRLRTRASKLEDQARRDLLLRLIDGHCRSFGETPFKYVDEMLEDATGITLFITSGIYTSIHGSFSDEEVDYDDWLQSMRRRRY
jgi:hypothetical protein